MNKKHQEFFQEMEELMTRYNVSIDAFDSDKLSLEFYFREEDKVISFYSIESSHCIKKLAKGCE